MRNPGLVPVKFRYKLSRKARLRQLAENGAAPFENEIRVEVLIEEAAQLAVNFDTDGTAAVVELTGIFDEEPTVAELIDARKSHLKADNSQVKLFLLIALVTVAVAVIAGAICTFVK